MSDYEEIDDAFVERATDKALLVVLDHSQRDKGLSRKVWIPKSVVDDDSEVWNDRDGRGPGTLRVARWFAEKEGLG